MICNLFKPILTNQNLNYKKGDLFMSSIKMIYDSTFDPQDYLDSFLNDYGLCESVYNTFPQIYEEDLYKYASEEKMIEYDDEIANVICYEKAHEERTYVIKGLIGLWNGTFEGGKIIKGMSTVISKCINQSDFFKFFIEKRCMHFTCPHHDGINQFWVKELTKRGEKYYEAHKDEMSDRKMVEKLYNDKHLSRHVTIWHEMYGM